MREGEKESARGREGEGDYLVRAKLTDGESQREGWGEVVRFSVPLRSFFWRLQSFFAAGFSFFKICVHLCPSVARFPLSAFRFSF